LPQQQQLRQPQLHAHTTPPHLLLVCWQQVLDARQTQRWVVELQALEVGLRLPAQGLLVEQGALLARLHAGEAGRVVLSRRAGCALRLNTSCSAS
jgi:hypothetical protein